MVKGEQLRQKRRELDLTQEQVSVAIGITQQAYSKLEKSEWVTKKYSGAIDQLEAIKYQKDHSIVRQSGKIMEPTHNPHQQKSATVCGVLGAYSCECGAY